MDEDRRIRFMVAPLLFLASLAWGIVRDPQVSLGTLLPGVKLDLGQLTGLLGAITAGGLALFPLGFVIGTITYVLLRLVSQLSRLFRPGSGCHEIFLSSEALAAVWSAIGMPGQPEPQGEHFAGVTFDHQVLRDDREGVHRWLIRRWNAFSIAVTSIVALALSLGAGGLFGIRWRSDWHVVVLGLCGVFLVSAFFAWRDTMGMLAFQARGLRAGGRGQMMTDTPEQPSPVGTSMDSSSVQSPIERDRLERAWRYYQHADDLQHRRCHFFLILQGALIAGFIALNQRAGLSTFLGVIGFVYAVLWWILGQTVQGGMDHLNEELRTDPVYLGYLNLVRRRPWFAGRLVLNTYLPALAALSWIWLIVAYWWF